MFTYALDREYGEVRLIFTTMLCILLPASALAQNALFCAVFSYGTQCYYYSADACRQAAGRDGMCVVNGQQPQRNSEPDFYGRMMEGMRQGELGAERGRDQRFSRLAGEAMNAKTSDELKQILAQAVATDPERGMKLAEYLGIHKTQQNTPTVLYRCETAGGGPQYTATPAIGCVVISIMGQ